MAGTCRVCGRNTPPGIRLCRRCFRAHPDALPGAVGAEVGRNRANLEIAKAVRAIGALRVVYMSLAVLCGILYLLPAILLTLYGAPYWIVPIAALSPGFYLLGWYDLPRRPVLWSIFIAATTTLSALSMMGQFLLASIDPLVAILVAAFPLLAPTWTVFTVIMAFGSVALWAAVIPCLRVGRLADRHPDLHIARRLRGEVPDPAPGEATARMRWRAASGRRTFRARAAGTTLAAGAAVVLAAGLWAALRTPPLDPALDRFAELWNGPDPEGVRTLLPPDSPDWLGASLERDVRTRWSGPLPPLEERRVETRGGRARATFGSPDGDIETLWEERGGAWRLIGLRLPPR